MTTETEIENTPTQNTKLKPNRLNYEGLAGQLYKIWLVNFFMKIITLGIYSFWGKTRLRKYLYGSFSLGGDRFEYTGTGGELFIGFLKVLPVLVIIFGPIAFLSEDYPVVILLYLPLMYLIPIAIYGAMRYRFSRTRWRGIRGRLSGSSIKYANISIGRSIINALTLGFAIPYSDIARMKYMYNNTYFGNVKAEFHGDGKRIFGAYIKSLLMTLVVLIIPAMLFATPIIIEAMSEGLVTDETATSNASPIPGLLSAVTYLLGILLAIMLFPVARVIYTAALIREQMRGLHIGDLRFKSTLTAMSLFKHNIGNMLWIVLTLGLATPIVINRRAQFFADKTIIGGNLDTSVIMQSKDQGITSGEGLEDAFDIDAGFI